MQKSKLNRHYVARPGHVMCNVMIQDHHMGRKMGFAHPIRAVITSIVLYILLHDLPNDRHTKTLH